MKKFVTEVNKIKNRIPQNETSKHEYQTTSKIFKELVLRTLPKELKPHKKTAREFLEHINYNNKGHMENPDPIEEMHATIRKLPSDLLKAQLLRHIVRTSREAQAKIEETVEDTKEGHRTRAFVNPIGDIGTAAETLEAELNP